MTLQDREYYLERAQAERMRAATATSVAAEIHLELASLYDKLAALDADERPRLSIVPDRRTA